jgi:hypothetical protein
MEFFKNLIRKLLKLFGYKLQKISVPTVKPGLFRNLAQAYELILLNESDYSIPPNDVRWRLVSRLKWLLPFEVYILVNTLAKSIDSPGDTCEFGVAQGATSALIANEIISGKKKLHLFDSFEGFSKPTKKDHLTNDPLSLGSIEAYEGKVSYPEKRVLARLARFKFPLERVVIHKGFIDKVLKEDLHLPKEVSVAFVDFDFYEPIKTALDFLHQVTSVGAIIIVHDYDGFSTGTKTAVDEFLSDTNASKSIYKMFLPDQQYSCLAILTRVG